MSRKPRRHQLHHTPTATEVSSGLPVSLPEWYRHSSLWLPARSAELRQFHSRRVLDQDVRASPYLEHYSQSALHSHRPALFLLPALGSTPTSAAAARCRVFQLLRPRPLPGWGLPLQPRLVRAQLRSGGALVTRRLQVLLGLALRETVRTGLIRRCNCRANWTGFDCSVCESDSVCGGQLCDKTLGFYSGASLDCTVTELTIQTVLKTSPAAKATCSFTPVRRPLTPGAPLLQSLCLPGQHRTAPPLRLSSTGLHNRPLSKPERSCPPVAEYTHW